MLIFIYNKRGTTYTGEKMVFSANGDKIIRNPSRKNEKTCPLSTAHMTVSVELCIFI